MNMKMNTQNPRIAIGLLLFVCVIGLISTRALSAEKISDTIEDTRTALEKWVETQRIISQEKRDLALSKEMLNERIELVQREIKSLREKIKEAETSIAEADKKRADLMNENEKLKNASGSLGGTLGTLENRTTQLIHRLPDPIQERIKPLSQRLPKEAEESKLSVAERYQNVVGILNEVDKFNRDITTTSENRTLDDGSIVEVAALYVGIGQAYYASANGKVAGIGTAGDDGWIWKAKNEAGPQILDALAILKNEKVASFVQVPVEIQ